MIVEPTTDRSAIVTAIAQLNASATGTRFRTALARASEVIGAREGRVVVITDLQQAGWESNDDGGLPDGVGVEVISVPPPAGNLAVTSAERRDRRIVASIQNYGNSEVRAPVRLIAGGKEIAKTDVTMAARGAADAELTGSLPATGDAEVRVEDAAGYQPDNVRQVAARSDARGSDRVVVADPTGSTGGLYVERALTVAGDGREFDVDVRDGREVSTWTAGRSVDASRAMFVLGTRTLDRSGRELIKNYLTRRRAGVAGDGPRRRSRHAERRAWDDDSRSTTRRYGARRDDDRERRPSSHLSARFSIRPARSGTSKWSSIGV